MSLLVTTTLLPHSNDTELIMYGHYYIRGKLNTQVTVNTNQITMMHDRPLAAIIPGIMLCQRYSCSYY